VRNLRAWGWFAAWAVAGGLLAFSVAAAASIGLFVGPVALLALWAILRARPPHRAAFGAVSGVGLLGIAIWALNGGSEPCPESGMQSVPPGAPSVECGGFDALPFLVAGIVLTLAGPALFALAEQRGRRARVG
jgi:hypothetical protein